MLLVLDIKAFQEMCAVTPWYCVVQFISIPGRFQRVFKVFIIWNCTGLFQVSQGLDYCKREALSNLVSLPVLVRLELATPTVLMIL